MKYDFWAEIFCNSSNWMAVTIQHITFFKILQKFAARNRTSSRSLFNSSIAHKPRLLFSIFILIFFIFLYRLLHFKLLLLQIKADDEFVLEFFFEYNTSLPLHCECIRARLRMTNGMKWRSTFYRNFWWASSILRPATFKNNAYNPKCMD